MNIQQLATNPTILFKESFSHEEASLHGEWEDKLKTFIDECCKIEFNSGSELLTLIEMKSNCSFVANNNHLIESFSGTEKKCSELLGAVLMSLIWLKAKKTVPKIIYCSEFYFFVSPDGEMTRVNSKSKNTLTSSQKFDLFNSEKSTQLQLPDLIKHYFEEICSSFITKQKYKSLRRAQSYMINFDPKDVKWYARRGLLLKRMGMFTEALSDLKRFISFHSYDDTPQSVKQALIELEGLKATDRFTDYSVH